MIIIDKIHKVRYEAIQFNRNNVDEIKKFANTKIQDEKYEFTNFTMEKKIDGKAYIDVTAVGKNYKFTLEEGDWILDTKPLLTIVKFEVFDKYYAPYNITTSNKINTKHTLIVKKCECGGNIDTNMNDNVAYLSNPPKFRFKCSDCGQFHYITENEFPHMELQTIIQDVESFKLDFGKAPYKLCLNNYKEAIFAIDKDTVGYVYIPTEALGIRR